MGTLGALGALGPMRPRRRYLKYLRRARLGCETRSFWNGFAFVRGFVCGAGHPALDRPTTSRTKHFVTSTPEHKS